MMTECVQNKKDENDDQDMLARNHHRIGDELSMRRVHSAYAEKLQSD